MNDLIDRSVAEHANYALADRKALLRELDRARKSHLAYDLGEHGEGINAVGTALLDSYGRPVAISIPVPEQRFAQQRPILEKALLNFRERMKKLLVK